MGTVRLAAQPKRRLTKSHVAATVRKSYEVELGGIGAFLPQRVPILDLPVVFSAYLSACGELPARYPRRHGGVRAWLDREFRRDRADVRRAIAALDTGQSDALMTALCALGHTYRWDSVPPVAARFDEHRVRLPPGIAGPWGVLANATGQPRVGSAWTLHLTNWQMTDRPGGAPYAPDELSRGSLRVARNWLAPPVDADLESFSIAFVLMEASGAAVVRAIVEGIEHAGARRVEETTGALHRLQSAIAAMTLGFSSNVRTRTIDPAVWLELIQPTYAWAPRGGPSGMQLGTVQAIDAALGIGSRSALAKLAGSARRHMPPPHRRFLRTLDLAGPALRCFVQESRCDDLTDRFDACVAALGRFRGTHKARGALYLRSRPPGDVGRASTGMTIGVHDEPLGTFERSMDERIAETQSGISRSSCRDCSAEPHVSHA